MDGLRDCASRLATDGRRADRLLQVKQLIVRAIFATAALRLVATLMGVVGFTTCAAAVGRRL